MRDPFFIGVDGGGTNCRARIADAVGNTLGEGTGGPANVRLDSALVMQSILTASRAAAKAASLTEDDLRRAHAGFGLAGAALTSANKRLLAEPYPFASIVIETDAYAAWLGAHQGGDGAILILGTGSCGLAVVGGQQFYVGGYGAEVSDEGSAQLICREAIRRTLWAHDGRAEKTPLSDALFAKLGGSAEAIVTFATTAKPADYARLFPLILEHAENLDPLGLVLMTEAAAGVVKIITRLLKVGAPSVCLIGGIAEPLSKWLPAPIRARISTPRGDALDGALLMARRSVEKAPAA
jgi:glucosamine kinase